MNPGLVALLFTIAIVGAASAPLWLPRLWALFPPIYRTPLNGAWEVLVASVEHRPQERRLDTYHAVHSRTGTSLWVSNGQDFLKVERGPLQGVSMPRYYRRRFLKAVRQMQVIEQQERFLKAWEHSA